MKAKFLTYALTLSAVLLSLASCQMREDVAGDGYPTDVTISVAAPAGYQLKSATNPGDGTLATRCIMEIYENGTLRGERQVAQVTDLSASFTARLVCGRDYQFVFWADYATGSVEAGYTDVYYNTEDLSAVTVVTDAYSNNVDERDAFFCSESRTVTLGEPLSFELKRPFGQVRVLTMDTEEYGADRSGVQAKLTLSGVPSTIDLLTGETSGTTSYTPADYVPAFDLTTGTQLTYDYVLAPATGQVLVGFALDVKDAIADLSTTTAENIPVQRNYRTNVSGNFLTQVTDITVNVTPGFDGDLEETVEAVSETVSLVTYTVEPTTDGADVTYTVEVAETVELTETGVEYRVAGTTDDYVAVAATQTRAEQAYAVTLTGLTAATEYEYRFYFTTAEGTTYSSVKTFTTSEETVEPVEPTAVTVAEFLAAEVSDAVWYQLTGTITDIAGTAYGNLTIEDETGSVYIYGLTSTKQETNDKSFEGLGLKVGDVLTLATLRGEYQGSAQGGGTPPAYYISHEPATVVEGDPNALLITEYVEGSSNNKYYIELTNISDAEIDLSAYALRKYLNGGADATSDLALSGTLAAHKSYVIMYNQAALTLPDGVTVDLTTSSTVMQFNGNDPMAIVCNGTVVDLLGVVGSEDSWGADKTLARKANCVPTATYNPEEWDVLDRNDVSGLGVYPNTVEVVTPTVSLVPVSTATEYTTYYEGTTLAFTDGVAPSFKVALSTAATEDVTVEYTLTSTVSENPETRTLTISAEALESSEVTLDWSVLSALSGVDAQGSYEFTVTLTSATTASETAVDLSTDAASWTVTVTKPELKRAQFTVTVSPSSFELLQNADGTINYDETPVMAGTVTVTLKEALDRELEVGYGFGYNSDEIPVYFGYFPQYSDSYNPPKIPAGETTFTYSFEFNFANRASNPVLSLDEETYRHYTYTNIDGQTVNTDIFIHKAAPTTSGETGGETEPESGDPKVGDYYYSDGTWSTTLDATKTPVAVVFWVGNAAEEDAKLAADFPDKTFQALAVSLNNVATQFAWVDENMGDWASNTANVSWTNSLGFTPNWSAADGADNLYGYANTAAIKAFFAAKGTDVDPYIGNTLAGLTNAPESSSGWYIPSGGEAIRMWTAEEETLFSSTALMPSDVRTVLNTSLSAVSGSDEIGSQPIWLSNVRLSNDGYAYQTMYAAKSGTSGGRGAIQTYGTTNGYYLRAVLAF